MEQVKQLLSRKRRTGKEIAALLVAYKSSGLSASQFCDQHHIHKSNFHKWISRAKERTDSRKKRRSAFAAVEVTASQSPLFAEVNGIRIYQPVTALYLKELKG